MNLDQVEKALSHYPNTLQALIAIGTLSAVISSVAIALAAARSNMTKLRAWVDTRIVVGGGAPEDNPPRYLIVSLTNKGNLAAWIEFSFFVWKVPFQREYYSLNPLDYYGLDRYYPRRPYPVEIAPRAHHSGCLSDFATFAQSIREMAARLRWARSLRMRFVRAYVWTGDGKRFRVKLSKTVRQQLIEAGNAHPADQ